MDLLCSLWPQNLKELMASLPNFLQELPNPSKINLQNEKTHWTKTLFFLNWTLTTLRTSLLENKQKNPEKTAQTARHRTVPQQKHWNTSFSSYIHIAEKIKISYKFWYCFRQIKWVFFEKKTNTQLKHKQCFIHVITFLQWWSAKWMMLGYG